MCVLLNYLDHPPFCIGKQMIIKLLPLAGIPSVTWYRLQEVQRSTLA